MVDLDALTRCPLTARQLEAARLSLAGFNYEDIGKKMGVSKATAHKTLKDARKAMGVSRLGLGALYATLLSRGCLRMPREIPNTEYYGTWLQGIVSDNRWRPSAAQRSYLNAFDRFLRRRDAVSATRMALAFQLMHLEAGLTPPALPEPEVAIDRLDEMLMRIGRGLGRVIPV